VKYTVSATDARIRFGEIMRRAKRGPVIVERGGKPEVVVISKQEYDQLVGKAPRKDQRKLLGDLHERLRVELAGRTLPDPVEIIQEVRKARDEQILSNLR
jgi:prevent-host-death family protein